jgi:hypothetical protein
MAIAQYLFKNYPACRFTLSGSTYDSLFWDEDNTLPKPSREEFEANIDYEPPEPTPEEIAQRFAIQSALAAKIQYRHDRAAEYPPLIDYIDGVVKGDQAQMQAYIDACLAVKAKYPKPEGAN